MIPARLKNYRKLWMGLGLLILMSPLGLLFLRQLRLAAPGGEWGSEELKSMLGHVPTRLENYRDFESDLARLFDAGLQSPGRPRQPTSLCGVIGASVIVAICLGLGRWLSMAEDPEEHHALKESSASRLMLRRSPSNKAGQLMRRKD
jgi:hypothetical protein